jgi:uncharacterized protein
MKRLIYTHIYWSFLLIFFCVPAFAAAYSSPGNPTGYVNDFADVIGDEAQTALEQKLAATYASSSKQIAVVTVKSLGNDYIENYASTLFAEWGIGNTDKDTGILLLVAVQDKKVRIEVGYGLEGEVTDIESAAIIRDTAVPAFKTGDYEGGIVRGTAKIVEALDNDTSNTSTTGVATKSSASDSIAIVLFFLAQGFVFVASILGRTKDWWLGGVLGFGLGVLATAFGSSFGVTVLSGLLITFFGTAFGLFFDYIVSSTYKKAIQNGSDVPWWTGGGSSSGSGFGGFGGGRSGGGGASGSW